MAQSQKGAAAPVERSAKKPEKPKGPPPELHGAEPEMMFYAQRLVQLSERFISLVAKLRHPAVDAAKADSIRLQMRETLNLIHGIEDLAHPVVHDAMVPVIYCEDLFISTETSLAIRNRIGHMPLSWLRSGDVRFIRRGMTQEQMEEIRAAARKVCKDFKLTIRDAPG